jgi:outer membrane lipoprotein-sorting protein
VNDLEAQFAQVRHLALTDETVSAAGRLRFINPDKFRLDYSTPDPDILAIRADTLLVYFASLKQAQRYRLSDDATTRNMFMLFSSERGRLEKAFDISLAPASPEGEALRLQPLPDQGHASVTEIRASGPEADYRRLFFREEGGDTVVFELKGEGESSLKARISW